MFKLKCMPATPMTQKEMEAQCEWVSKIPEISEQDELEMMNQSESESEHG